jgi:N-carbamoylputrescine amidase
VRVGFVEWPEALEPLGPDWTKIAELVASARLDLLVTNELPFGRWIAAESTFSLQAAQASIDTHNEGLTCLAKLNVAAVLSSRPVSAEGRLANEAFVTERGKIRRLHRKRYFPAKPGWFETSWYCAGREGFRTSEVSGMRIGVLLCTDAMFNEHARHYGREGADLIAIPRATGISLDNWLAAGKMAAIVSGSYVVSSNRVGPCNEGVTFGGAGFAYHPDGSLLAVTTPAEPLLVIDVEPEISARQRASYPCYVVDPDYQLQTHHVATNTR